MKTKKNLRKSTKKTYRTNNPVSEPTKIGTKSIKPTKNQLYLKNLSAKVIILSRNRDTFGDNQISVIPWTIGCLPEKSPVPDCNILAYRKGKNLRIG